MPSRAAAIASMLGILPMVLRAEAPLTFTTPSGLSATVSGRNIDLKWLHSATAPGGCWIEFATPGDDYTKLDAVPPGTTTFRHPMVVPETKLIYRVLPYFGMPSAAVEITTGRPAPGTTERLEEGPLSEGEAKIAAGAAQAALRSAASFRSAAPDGLQVRLSSPTSVELRWQDRASDEDGFLVEVSAGAEEVFRLCALLPPDATSFRKVQLPPGSKCRFRVRAFFYGEASRSAEVLSPPAKN